VRDVALLLDVIAGPDPRAPLALGPPASRFRDLTPTDLTGTRVAWSRDLDGLPVDPAVAAVLEPARATLVSLGCTVTDAEPSLRGADEAYATLRALAFATSFAPLVDRPRDTRKATGGRNIQAGLALTGEDVARATRLRGRVVEGARRFFERHHVLCAPAAPVPAFDVDLEWVQQIAGTPMTSYVEWTAACSRVTVMGTPALSVPAGFTPDGLPVGLQLVARAGDEARLLQVAAAFESATRYGERAPAL
jgi:amidase